MRKRSVAEEKGVALLTAFSLSLVLMALIAALYLVTTQRYVIQKKRSEHERNLYLTEAGVSDAVARLRIGTSHASGINPVTGGNYCLNVTTGAKTATAAACPASCASGWVRVCITNNSSGRNQINVRATY